MKHFLEHTERYRFRQKIKKIKKNKPISRYRFVIFLKMLRFKKQVTNVYFFKKIKKIINKKPITRYQFPIFLKM